jgi:RecJ-like exonuclease
MRSFRVPIGRYRAVVNDAVLGDSLEVATGTQEFTVGQNDSIGVIVALTFMTRSIAELRALPLGSKSWVRGVVMNVPSAFGDSTVHLSDSTTAIRASGVRPQLPIAIGDTVRFLGRRTVRDGQPSIQVFSIVVEAIGTPTPADSLSTLDASMASSGTRDARLVRVAAAMVSDTLTVNGAKTMTVNDGSGPLTIVLPPNTGFNPLAQWRPGISIDAVGLLVPDAASPGKWILKPRNRPDLTILP